MREKLKNESLENNRAKEIENSFKTVYKAGATEINESFKGAAGRALAKGNNEPMRIYNENKKAIDEL